jgi:YVTN family beta-propeller protein
MMAARAWAPDCASGIVAACLLIFPVKGIAAPFAYVLNPGRDMVSVLDTATNALTATIPVGRFPRGVAVRPDGRRVYVTNYDDATVSVIDGGTNSVVATVPVLPGPRWVAAGPDGSMVYVAHVTRPGYISVLDTRTDQVIDTVEVGNFLAGIAPSLDGKRLYVAGTWLEQERRLCTLPSPLILYCDIPLYVVGMTPPRHTLSFRAIGDYLEGVAVSPDGRTIYVADQEATVDGSSKGRVTLLDATVLPNAIRARLDFDFATVPKVLAVHPDGLRLYVGGLAAGGGGMLWVIDEPARVVLTSIRFVMPVSGLSLTPDGTRLYVVQQHEIGGIFAESNPGVVHAFDTVANAIMATVRLDSPALAPGQFIRPPVRCVGDCDGSGDVGIAELVGGVNIALGRAALETCPACDGNGDDAVTVPDLVRAIGNALNGCPFQQPAAR